MYIHTYMDLRGKILENISQGKNYQKHTFKC